MERKSTSATNIHKCIPWKQLHSKKHAENTLIGGKKFMADRYREKEMERGHIGHQPKHTETHTAVKKSRS